MKRLICIISVAVSMLAISSISHAVPSYLTSFTNTYSGTSGMTIAQCILCHNSSSGGSRNAYGTAYANAGHNFVTIEGADSDGDTFTNIAEINARTFPGNANSKPAAPPPPPPPADTTPPTVSITSHTNGQTASGTVTITASASDNVGVTGVQFRLDGANLGAQDIASPYSVSWDTTTATNASHTLTAVARDAAGNTTPSAAVTVTVSNVAPPPPPPPPAQDTMAPTVSVFTVPADSTSLTVPITAFAASDNVGVTGVMIRESAASPSANASGWLASAPTSLTFANAGTKTLYAWAKDAAGNVSAGVSATVTITLSVPPPPGPGPQPQVGMEIWANTWFEVTIRSKGVSAQDMGLTGESRKAKGYLNIHSWDPDNNILDATLYQHDQETGQWNSVPIPLSYASGGPMNLQVSAQTAGSVALGFTARIKGTEKNGALRRARFKTLGGYLVQSGTSEEDEDEEANPRDAAGWLKINGKMVPESAVPVP